MTTLFTIGLINALQATLLALCAWLITRVWRHPALVQMLWVLVLVKLITPPLISVPWQWTADASSSDVDFAKAAAPAESIATAVLPRDAIVHEFALHDDLAASDSQIMQPVDFQAIGPMSPVSQVDQDRASSDALATNSHPAAVPWQPIAIMVWTAGSVIYLGIAGRRLILFHRALRGTTPAPGEIQTWADDVASRIGMTRDVRLRMTEARLAPLVWPLGRPTILLSRPLLEQLSPEEAQTLLAHEFAHLRRKDHWVRWLELAVTAIYWWHPVVWWARRTIQQAEERACDAWVVGTFPETARAYAAALLKAIEFVSEPTQAAVPMLASRLTPGNDFKERIEHVMNATWNNRLPLPIRLAVLFVAVAILPLSLQMVRAEDEQASQANDAASAPADGAVPPVEDAAVEPHASTPLVDADPFAEADEEDLFGPPADDPFDTSAGKDANSATPQNDRRTLREKEIERGLRSPVRLQYVDTPLEEVINVLSEDVGVDIHLDPRGLSEEGVKKDTPVTIDLNREVSLASGLNLILEPLHLGYVIEDEVLKITSERRRAERDPTPQRAAKGLPRPAFPWEDSAAALPWDPPIGHTRISPGDIVGIAVVGAWADAPIADEYLVEPAGTVALGPHYGRVKIAGQTLEGAEEAITKHLEKILENPQVQVTLGDWKHGRGPNAEPRYANYPHTPPAANRPPGDLQSYAALLHQPMGAAELEILREHVQFLEEQFKAVDARFKAGSTGGSKEVREMAASKLALAKTDLALAEARQDGAQAQVHLARKHAEEALKAVQAAYEAGHTTHDVVLKAAQDLANVKRKLIQVQHATANTTTYDAPVSDAAPATRRQSAQTVASSQPTDSIGVLKKIVEAKERDYERVQRLREKEEISDREADDAKTELEISRERLLQAQRTLEYRQLLVELAEVEYQQAAQANSKAPGAVSELELRKLKLKVELAKAKFRELAE